MAGPRYNTHIFEPDQSIYRTGITALVFTGTVTGEGIDKDESGNVVVPYGTLIDKDGKAVIPDGSGEFSSDPIGILESSLNVTEDGTMPCGLCEAGDVLTYRIFAGYEEEKDDEGYRVRKLIKKTDLDALKTKLPRITFYGEPDQD